MDQAWRVLSSETLVRDRWIDLRADDCLTPQGQEISPYYVLSYPDWVHVVALTSDNQLVLVKQYRHGAGYDFLEPPGGAIEATDETIEIAARRELVEETGYVSDDWQYLGALHPNAALQNNRLHLFLARDARLGRAPALDPGEEGLSVHLMPAAEVVAGLSQGMIGQSLHVTSLVIALAAAGRISLAAI